MSCRYAASLAAGYFLLTRSREAAKNYFFYPQITQINADFGGMSCRYAASLAAGYFLLTRSREAAKKTKAPAK